MKKIWTTYVPMILSVIALVITLYTSSKLPMVRDGSNSFTVLATVLAILVTVLIGWQISTVIDIKDDRKQWEKIMCDNEKLIYKYEKELRDNFIAFASIIAAANADSIYLRIHKWLYIIESCDEHKEAELIVQIAATYIANEFNNIARSNKKLEEKFYQNLWKKESFKKFIEISVLNDLLSDGALLIAQNTLNIIEPQTFRNN